MVRLADQSIVVLWTGVDHVTWAQRIDLQRGMSGATARVGQLTSGESRLASDPLAVALPSGDLALVGLLADGRITYARGSSVNTRRIGPRVVVLAGERPITGLAAAGSGEAVIVVALRAATTAGLNGTMEVAIYRLNAEGEASRPPLSFDTENGFAVRATSCGGTLHLAWRTRKGVVTNSIDSAGLRTAEVLIGGTRSIASDFGPIFCAQRGDDGAVLLSSFLAAGSMQSTATVGVAELSATSGAKPTWKLVKLPGLPQSTLVGDSTLAAYGEDGAASLIVEQNGKSHFVTLEVAKRSIIRRELEFLGGSCIPIDHGRHAVCGASRSLTTAADCRDAPSELSIALFGDTPSIAAGSGDAFWARGVIESVENLPPAERGEHAARMWCGTEDWPALRTALDTWCAEPVNDSETRQLRAPFCKADQPTTLLYQAKHCSDQPLLCGVTPRTQIPSVSRDELAAGRVELNYANCSVWFERTGTSWSVADSECAGED